MAQDTFSFALDVIDGYAQEDRTGLVFIDGVGHRRDYAFREIASQSQRYAAVLRAFGVARGDRVALRTTNSAKCLFTMLGLERLGAVRVPCPQVWTPGEVVHAVNEARVTTLIANRRYREELDAVRERMPAVQRFIIVGEEYEEWARLDSLVTRAQPLAGTAMEWADPAIIAGGIVYTQQALYEASIEAANRLGLTHTDRFWAAFPFGTHEWIANTLVAGWSSGASVVVHEGSFDALERIELVRELEVTVLLQSLQEYEELLALEGVEIRLPRLRQSLCSGDPPNVARPLQTA